MVLETIFLLELMNLLSLAIHLLWLWWNADIVSEASFDIVLTRTCRRFAGAWMGALML